MAVEVFNDIAGTNYAVSNKGNVKSYNGKGRILKPKVDKDGYHLVSLRIGGKSVMKRVHLLVIEAFGKKVVGKDICDHINNIPNDNRIENLQWVTNRYNTRKDKSKKHPGIFKEEYGYRVRLKVNGKNKSFGTYKEYDKAVDALNKALKQHK